MNRKQFEIFPDDIEANNIINKLIQTYDEESDMYYDGCKMKINDKLILIRSHKLCTLMFVKNVTTIINNMNPDKRDGIDITIDGIRYVNFIRKENWPSSSNVINIKSDPLSSIIFLSLLEIGKMPGYFEANVTARFHHCALKIIELLKSISVKINYKEIAKLFDYNPDIIFVTELSVCEEIYKLMLDDPQYYDIKDIKDITIKSISEQFTNKQAAIWLRLIYKKFPSLKISIRSLND